MLSSCGIRRETPNCAIRATWKILSSQPFTEATEGHRGDEGDEIPTEGQSKATALIPPTYINKHPTLPPESSASPVPSRQLVLGALHHGWMTLCPFGLELINIRCRSMKFPWTKKDSCRDDIEFIDDEHWINMFCFMFINGIDRNIFEKIGFGW